MAMYMPLLAKMAEDILLIMFAKLSFEFLYDLNLFISLSYLLPMLETIQILIKFAQKRDVFVCNYVTTINIC